MKAITKSVKISAKIARHQYQQAMKIIIAVEKYEKIMTIKRACISNDINKYPNQ